MTYNHTTEKKQTQIKEILVTFSDDLRTKLDTITREYEYEMMGYLTGERTEYGIHCDGILIPHQKGLKSVCEVDPDGLIKMRKEYGEAPFSKIVGHFHSHIKMSLFWSATDIAQQEEYASEREETLFIVGANGEYIGRYIVSKPFLISTDNVKITQLVDTEILEELKLKVKNEDKTEATQLNHLHSYNYRNYADPNKPLTGIVLDESFVAETEYDKKKEKMTINCSDMESFTNIKAKLYYKLDASLSRYIQSNKKTMTIVINRLPPALAEKVEAYVAELTEPTAQEIAESANKTVPDYMGGRHYGDYYF